MHIIIWEYLVKAEHQADFEKFYSPNGAWTMLFRKGAGYLNTELHRDSKQPLRYITLDRWVSAEDYEAFMVEWEKEYRSLDVQCESFTERESRLGAWESVNRETR